MHQIDAVTKMDGLNGLSLQLYEPPLTANNHSPDYQQINSISDDNNNNLTQQNYNMNHEHHHNHQQHLPASHADNHVSTSNTNGQQQVIVHRVEQNQQQQQQQPVHVPKPRGRRKKIRTEPIRPICPQCEKQFSNQSALTKHKLTHSDERKFACQQCSKAFKRHDHLTGHMQTHSNRKPFNCTIQGCDKTYCDARSLRRHKENIHHIITPRENNHHSNNNMNHHDHSKQTNGISHNDNNSINCDGLDTSIGINSITTTTTTIGVLSATKNTTADQLRHSSEIDLNNNDVSSCNGSFVCDRDSATSNGHHLDDGRLMSAGEQQQHHQQQQQQQQQIQPLGDATSLNYHHGSQTHLNQYNNDNQQHHVDFKSTHEMSTNTTNCPPPSLPHHTQQKPMIQSLAGNNGSNNNGLGPRWPPHVHPNNQHHLQSSHHHHHQHHSSYNHHGHQAPFSADYALAQNHHHFSFDFNHIPHFNGTHSNQAAINQPPHSAASLTDLSGISSKTSVSSRQQLHELPAQQQQLSNPVQPYGGYLTPTTLHPSPQYITNQNHQQATQMSYQPHSNQQHHQSSNDPTVATTTTTTTNANTNTDATSTTAGADTTPMLQHTSPPTSNLPPTGTIQETQQSSLYQRRIQRHHSDGGSYVSLECQSDRLDLMRGPTHSACAADSSTQHHQQQYHHNHHPHASYSADYASSQHFDFEFNNSNRDNNSTTALGPSSGSTGNGIGNQHAISLTDLGSGNLASPVVINQESTPTSGGGGGSGVAMDSMDTMTTQQQQQQHAGYLTPTTLHPVSEQPQPSNAYQTSPSEQVSAQSPNYATSTRAAPTQTPTTPTTPSACAQQPSHLLRRRIQRLHSAQSSYGGDPEQAARLDLINRPVQIGCSGGGNGGPVSSGAIQSVTQHLGNNTSQMNHYQTANNHIDHQSQQQQNQHNFHQQQHHHNHHHHHQQQQNNLHQASYSADYASTQHFNFEFTNHHVGDHHHLHADHPLGSNTIPLSADSITDSGLGLNMHFEQQMTPNTNQQYELKL